MISMGSLKGSITGSSVWITLSWQHNPLIHPVITIISQYQFLLDRTTIWRILTVICKSLHISVARCPAYYSEYFPHYSQYSLLRPCSTSWYWDAGAYVHCIILQLFRFLATLSLRSPACCGERLVYLYWDMLTTHIVVMYWWLCEQLCSFLRALLFCCCFALNSKI